jgi:Protein of unknown function (DUF3667)
MDAHNTPTLCLNCNAELLGAYCATCGQKSSTHRFSLRSVVTHDFVHGVFHFDRGILFTIKELCTRPGHVVRAYIEGKRAPLFNYFSLVILLITLWHIISQSSSISAEDLIGNSSLAIGGWLDHVSAKYPKTFGLCTVPILSGITYFTFKKAGLNYSEHVVMNLYKLSVEMLLTISFSVYTLLDTNIPRLQNLQYVMVVLILAYNLWFYYQFFSTYGYRKLSLLVRVVVASFGLFVLFTSITLLYLGLRIK